MADVTQILNAIAEHRPAGTGSKTIEGKNVKNPMVAIGDPARTYDTLQTCEASVTLAPGQRPSRVKLNIVFEGKGTIWIKDVELRRGQRPPRE